MTAKKSSSSGLFLISFLPAVVYWYLEEHYDVRTAAFGGFGLALIEILGEKIFLKSIHKISIYNFILITVLSLMSLMAEDGLWFKLSPMITGLAFGGLLYFKAARGKGLMMEMMQEMNRPLPMAPEFLVMMEKHMGLFMAVYGLGMGALALWATSGVWLFFKTGGFYLATLLFFFVEIMWLRGIAKKMRQM